MDAAGLRIQIAGVVQGVGFRPWVWRLAHEEGLAGRVANDPAGVTIDAFGPLPALGKFEERLRTSPPPAAVITGMTTTPIPVEPDRDFVIVASTVAGVRRVSIPPDLATCAECAAEVLDPADRRYRYPFTNCTSCGPRLTIALGVPYDRAQTTMAAFRMCGRCQAEYDDPGDRRFHAQPNACPACGPRLRAVGPDGAAVSGDPLRAAGHALREGRIVALKGVGGFHLACDATSGDAVARLRARKRRDEKPFAVMVPGLAAAEALADFSPPEAALLTSVERPIVLVRARPGAVAADVAPSSPLLGVMLAYSPLHLLVLHETGGHPLVMTSGNVGEEPMAIGDAEALERLAGIADLFLLHDREIALRCDDSVARVIAGAPVVFRRSRGYVPRPIRLARPVVAPVLACGAHLKNTFCLAAGSEAWLGPHVGDLDTVESLASFADAVASMERFLGIVPEVIAYDLHPDYASTAYAHARPEAIKIGVQHHHAHVASAMAEHALAGPVLGIAYDGSGYGTDGTSWGGELLLAGRRTFERLGTFRSLPLPGGEAAIREVWRLALGLLDDAFGDEAPLDRFALFGGERAAATDVVRRMMRRGFNAPRAHGVGRYFDAVAALVLGRSAATFEGQAALAWNVIADPREACAYPYAIDRGHVPWEVDLRPMTRALVRDALAGIPAPIISARFHNTIAAATAGLVRAAADSHRRAVVLTGGCFQNERLAEAVVAALPGFDVRLHRDVPPGDGGLALGQALVADAVMRGQA